MDRFTDMYGDEKIPYDLLYEQCKDKYEIVLVTSGDNQ